MIADCPSNRCINKKHTFMPRQCNVWPFPVPILLLYFMSLGNVNTHIIPLTNAWKKEGRKKGSFKARRYVSLYAFRQRPLLLLLLLFLPWRLPPALESPSLDEYLDSSTSASSSSCCPEPGGRKRKEGRKAGSHTKSALKKKFGRAAA